ncbi:MAG: hypothetical protein OHK0046_25560 [Anaerolineae bacterium]
MLLEMVVALYQNSLEADRAFGDLYSLHLKNEIHLIDAAVMEKDADGDTNIKELTDLSPSEGRGYGALVGALLGLVGGPIGGVAGAAVGAFVGAAGGALIGGFAARKIDSGIENEDLKQILAMLSNGSSAIMVVAERQHIARIMPIVEAFNADIHRYDLSVSINQKLPKQD